MAALATEESSGEIAAALERLRERARAVDPGGVLGSDEGARLFHSGFDLDEDELDEQSELVLSEVREGILASRDTLPPHLREAPESVLVAACGSELWVNGVLAGLLIAEARQRRGE